MSDKFNEQQQKVLDAQGNVLVSASAGSGKTTVMIEKILTLLRAGNDIRRILVITFTNDAAAEMREKLVNKMFKEIRVGTEQSSKLKMQLENLPFANICTMDSFWKTLYKKYFAVIGGDPSLRLIDPQDGAVMLNESINKVFEKHIAENNDVFFSLSEAMSVGRKLENFAKELLNIRTFVNSQVDEEEFLSRAESEVKGKSNAAENYFIAYAEKQIRLLCGEIQSIIYKTSHESDFTEETESLKNLKGTFSSLYWDGGVASLKDEFDRLILPSVTRKSKQNDILKAEYKKLCNTISDVVEELAGYIKCYFDVRADNSAEVVELIELLRDAEKEYSRQKAMKNFLDFNDLSRYAVKILQNEKAREEICSGFDYIFVDEYQDTNPRQEFLLNCVGNGNNIFVVGDVKQSIYRFRHSEPSIFTDRMKMYTSLQTGQNIGLNTNYRSDGRILKFADSVFCEVMRADFGGADYDKVARFEAGTDYKTVDVLPPVNISLLKKDEREAETGGKIYSVASATVTNEKCDAEAILLAQKISNIVGKTLLYKPKEKNVELAKYGDIAVLVGKWAQAAKIGAALGKMNIPYTVLRDENKDLPERERLINHLRILINPTDDAILMSVLCCEMYNFTSWELSEIRKNNTDIALWDSLKQYKGNETLEIKIKCFFVEYDNLREKSTYLSVSELLGEILDRGYCVWLAKKGGNTVGEINAFVSFVKKSVLNNDLVDFISYYDANYNGNFSPREDNAVTITTVFKSKGLEYPIVFLPFTHEKRGGGGNRKSVFADSELGVAVMSFIAENRDIRENFAVKVQRLKEKCENAEENVRLLYVALTRAKNHLFISGRESASVPRTVYESTSFLDMINYAAQNNGGLSNLYKIEESIPEFDEVLSPVYAGKMIALDFLEKKYAYSESEKLFSKMSVTAIVEEENGVVQTAPERTYKKRTEINEGIIYHTVLQHIDFSAGTRNLIVSELQRMYENGIITEEEKNVIDVERLFCVMNSRIIRFAADKKCFREQPFMLYRTVGAEDHTLVQGIIDLIIFDGEAASVVDFKTSQASKQVLVERYAKQLDLYAESVKKLWKVPVKAKILYNLIKNEEILLP